MKIKIFENFSRFDLEKELNEFAKNNDILQISLATTEYGCETCYSFAVGYIPKQEERNEKVFQRTVDCSGQSTK